MRVVVVAGGSRGDVEPLVALSCGIRDAGHEVTLVAADDAEPVAAAHGLAFVGMGFSSVEQMRSPSGSAWIRTANGNPFRERRLLLEVGRVWAPRVADGLLGLAGTADLFVSGILSLDAVDAIARHDGVPHHVALLSPFHPTADGRSAVLAPLPRHRSPLNRWAGQAMLGVVGRMFGPAGQLVRTRLGLPARGPRDLVDAMLRTPTVLGAGRLLVPPPHDWPRHVHVTGRWHLPTPEGWVPPPALADVLDDGAPPVYLGFGSMAEAERSDVVALARAAAGRTGRRLLLRTGRDGAEVVDGVLEIGDAPHGRLLPRTAAVIHHGGAGTTHAAVRAGVPSAAVPHIGDQPYWGRRLAELGVGVPAVPRHRLDEAALADLITALTTRPGLAPRAARAGELLRREHGVDVGVRALGLSPAAGAGRPG